MTDNLWALGISALSAVVTIIGASISALSVSQNIRIANRQHAFALSADLVKWGIDVLAAYKVITSGYDNQITSEERFSLIKAGGNDLINLYERGGFLLPTLMSPAIVEVQTAIFKAHEDCASLGGGLRPINEEFYLHSRARLVNNLRDEIGVTRRYNESREALK